MYRYLVAFDISQDSFIGSRLSPQIVFRLQPVDGHNDLETLQAGPGERDWSKSAGNDLHVRLSDQLGEKNLEFAIPNQRVAADDGKVQRFVLLHQVADSPDEFFSSEIGQAAKICGP